MDFPFLLATFWGKKLVWGSRTSLTRLMHFKDVYFNLQSHACYETICYWKIPMFNWYLHRLIHAGFSIAISVFCFFFWRRIYTCVLPLNAGFGMVLLPMGTFGHPLECHEVLTGRLLRGINLRVWMMQILIDAPYEFTHLANGPWNKGLNFTFPTKYVIPKSLKFSHWPSKFNIIPEQFPSPTRIRSLSTIAFQGRS